MKIINLFTVSISLFIMISCSDNEPENNDTPSTELSGNWELDYLVHTGRTYETSEICNLNNEQLLLEISPVSNGAATLTGNSPCNDFGSAMINVTESSFDLTEQYATEVGCSSTDCEIDGSDFEEFIMAAYIDFENPDLTHINYRISNYGSVDSLVLTSGWTPNNRLYYWRTANP